MHEADRKISDSRGRLLGLLARVVPFELTTQLESRLRLREDLDIDSLALGSALLSMEAEFGFSFEDVDVDFSDMETVDDFLARCRETLVRAGFALSDASEPSPG